MFIEFKFDHLQYQIANRDRVYEKHFCRMYGFSFPMECVHFLLPQYGSIYEEVSGSLRGLPYRIHFHKRRFGKNRFSD